MHEIMHETEFTHGKAIQTFLSQANQILVCSIDGRQISLGKDREAAHKKFHTLMAAASSLATGAHRIDLKIFHGKKRPPTIATSLHLHKMPD